MAFVSKRDVMYLRPRSLRVDTSLSKQSFLDLTVYDLVANNSVGLI